MTHQWDVGQPGSAAALWTRRSRFESLHPSEGFVAEGISSGLLIRRRWFDSNRGHAFIAQLVELPAFNWDVGGSSPSEGTYMLIGFLAIIPDYHMVCIL